MNKKISLGNFFLLVAFVFVTLALTWYNFRRDNYVANQNDEDGMDISSPYYADRTVGGMNEPAPGHYSKIDEEGERDQDMKKPEGLNERYKEKFDTAGQYLKNKPEGQDVITDEKHSSKMMNKDSNHIGSQLGIEENAKMHDNQVPKNAAPSKKK